MRATRSGMLSLQVWKKGIYVYKYLSIGHVILELSSYLLEFPMTIIQHAVNSNWLFNTQSRVLQADSFVLLEIIEKATLNIYMPYLQPLPVNSLL